MTECLLRQQVLSLIGSFKLLIKNKYKKILKSIKV